MLSGCVLKDVSHARTITVPPLSSRSINTYNHMAHEYTSTHSVIIILMCRRQVSDHM
jgi:hypothetical protein